MSEKLLQEVGAAIDTAHRAAARYPTDSDVVSLIGELSRFGLGALNYEALLDADAALAAKTELDSGDAYRVLERVLRRRRADKWEAITRALLGTDFLSVSFLSLIEVLDAMENMVDDDGVFRWREREG